MTLNSVVTKISQANEFEVEIILKAVQQRYAVLFPDWELNIISLQKSADRNKQLDLDIAMLQNLKKHI